MAVTNPERQLENFINNMYTQGILDRSFDQVKELRNADQPQFLLEIITMFYRDAESNLEEVTRIMDEPAVDFAKVTEVVHQIKGSSSSIGGRRMVLACEELCLISDGNDKEGRLQALDRVKNEFYILQEKLNIICQLEREIVSIQTRRRP